MARPVGSKNIKWDKDRLYELYHVQGLNSNEVGEKLGGIPGAAVRIAMHRLGIPVRTLSEATRGERHYAYKGRTKTSTGYWEVYMPEHHRANKRHKVYEHILVWEKANGYLLPDGLVIHHLNGIKTDNRPENLVAIATKRHNKWIPILQKRIRQLEKELGQLRRCSQEVMELV